jgi:hypothetical protein
MMMERLVKVVQVYFSLEIAVGINRIPMKEECLLHLKTAEALLQMVITEFLIQWI